MPDREQVLRLFKNAMSYRDSKRVVLNSAKQAYSEELDVLQETGENLADRLKATAKRIIKGEEKEEYYPKTSKGTTPTISQERYENSFMKTDIDAARIVMRPKPPVVKKKSAFFKNVKYDVSVSNIVSERQIGHNSILARDLDFFDKTMTLNFQKVGDGGYTKLSAGAGYNFFKKRIKLDVHYTLPEQFMRGRIYLEKDNPGINAEYIKEMPRDGALSVNAGVFKEDAAFQIEYNTNLDDKMKVIVGAYGTTKYKEAGVYGRVEF